MGQLILADSKMVYPYQSYLRIQDFFKVYPFFRDGKHLELFPCYVAKFPNALIVLDGHHRFALAEVYGVKLNSWVMDNENDLINRFDFPELDSEYKFYSNMTAGMTYYLGVKRAKEIGSNGFDSAFKSLNQKHGINSIKDIEKFIRAYENDPDFELTKVDSVINFGGLK